MIDVESSMASTMTRAGRDKLLEQYEAALQRLAQAGRQQPALSWDELKPFKEAPRNLLKEYYAGLPRLNVSRCPYCGNLLERAIDPWGLDGLWWQSSQSGSYQEPEPCTHFRVLLGAVNLNGHPVLGGRNEARPGPEVPYVIPRILELPTMSAVVAVLPLACAYTAYPIAYFSEVCPGPGALTQPWTKQQYAFQDEDGRPAWTVRTDPWDFDLLLWGLRGKLKWIEAGDPTWTLRQSPDSVFPYANLPGIREQVIIRGTQMTTLPPPRGEAVKPFSG